LFSKGIGWLKDVTRPLRQALPLARLPGQSPLHDVPTVIGLARGRLLGREHIRLTFSNAYAYKFRYLHRGLTQLAAAGAIRYSFLGYDCSLGRKTAIIRYDAPGMTTVTGVIDGSAATWELGQPDIDLDCLFGDSPRILLKLEYSEQRIHTRPSTRGGGQDPPIGFLYGRVTDGAYWPINEHFLDERWVARQQQRQSELLYDIMAIYGLKLGDLRRQGHGDLTGQSERVRFLLALDEPAHSLDLRLRVGVKGHPSLIAQLPPQAFPYVIEEYLPYDEYLDVVFQSRLLYCPKNDWHDPNSEGAGERTYRLFENLALGRVCLSSPVKLHCDFEPGVHYVAIASDFSNLEEVIAHYLSHPDELERIRQNVLPMYSQHLSPVAIGRYYANKLRNLSTESAP
jgi:hypothetical protein